MSLDYNTLDNDITCPYCNYEFSEPWEYEEGDYEIECPNCYKNFHHSGQPTIIRSVAKDCELNNEEHSWKPYYKELYKCEKCDKTELIYILRGNNNV